MPRSGLETPILSPMQSSMAQFQPSFSFLPVDPNMELMNQYYFTELNAMGIPNLNFQSFMDFPNSNSLTQQQLPEFPENLAEIFSGNFHRDDKNVLPVTEPVVSSGNEFHESSQKKKAMDVPESSSGNSSPPVSEERIKRKNISRRRKRMRGSKSEEEKPKGVVHVRARRGQATDSHSLAERVRRGKINERLRCLQDIMPGCCKTMGMAGILDEIINYVQSLQNQVEFLSMKLVAASTFHNFNLQMDATEEAMQRAKACEGQKVQRPTVAEGFQGLIASAQLGSSDLTCGGYFSLPYNP